MAIESINRAIKEEITQLEKRLKVLRRIIDFNSDTKPAKRKPAKAKQHGLSRAARAKISAAQKKRWAAKRKADKAEK